MTTESTLVSETVDFVMLKGGEGRFGALNRAQRVVYAITELDSTIAEYSLYDYYDCHAGMYAAFAVTALKEIAVEDSAALIRSANDLFPKGQPALNLGQRREQLELLGDDVKVSITEIGDQFMACDDGLGEKFAAFVLANQKDLMAE